MSQKVKMIRRRIRDDEKYKRFKVAQKNNPNNVIDFENLHKEMARLHKTRSVRSLKRKSKGFVNDVVDALLQDQQARSRCAEIVSICIEISGSMTQTLDNLRDYLVTEYAELLKAVGTVGERKMVVESVLRPFYEYLSNIEQLRQHAKVIMEDVDKAGYGFTNLVNTLQMLSRPERIL